MTARKKSAPVPTGADNARALRIFAALEKTASGTEAIEFIRQHNVHIIFVDKIKAKHLGKTAKDNGFLLRATAEELDDGSFAVYLRNDLPDSIVTSNLMHELRHVWQFSRNLNKPERQTPFERLVRLGFMEADAYSFQIMNAWEMAQAGDKNAWLFVKMEFPVMTAAFEKSITETGDILCARRAVFEAFFEHTKLSGFYAEIGLQMGVNDLEAMSETIVRKKLVPDTVHPRHAAPVLMAHKRDPETRLSRKLLLVFGEAIKDNGKNYLRDVPGRDVTDKRLLLKFSAATRRKLEEIEKTYDMKPAHHRRIFNPRRKT